MYFIINRINLFIAISSILLAIVATHCRSANQRQFPPVLVAAASDLIKVSRPLADAFQGSHSGKVRFNFGSSRQLEQQIRQGAPYDVFAPAARSFSVALARDGFLEGEAKVYALGRLVVWSKTLQLKSLDELRGEGIRRVAIANPRYAPYGVAARQALESAGVWPAVEPKLVYGDSVAHAFQMAETGNADVALVALALVQEAGRPFLPVEPRLHAPIEQSAAVLKASRNQPAAKAFVEFLSSAEARRILQTYGFGLP